MARKQPTTRTPRTPTAQAERRRSQRFRLVVPVDMAWKVTDDLVHKEHAETEEVNAHGALLRLKDHTPPVSIVKLRNVQTGNSSLARVVGKRNPTPESLARIAIELAFPSYSLWGINSS